MYCDFSIFAQAVCREMLSSDGHERSGQVRFWVLSWDRPGVFWCIGGKLSNSAVCPWFFELGFTVRNCWSAFLPSELSAKSISCEVRLKHYLLIAPAPVRCQQGPCKNISCLFHSQIVKKHTISITEKRIIRYSWMNVIMWPLIRKHVIEHVWSSTGKCVILMAE